MHTHEAALRATSRTVIIDARPTSDNRSVLDFIILFVLAGVLIFGPLAFGTIEPWSLLAVRMGVVLLVVLWGVQQLISGSVNVISSPLFFPVGVFALLIGGQLAFGLTAYRYATLAQALQYVAFAMLLFVAVQTFGTKANLQIFGWIAAGFGSLLALYSLIQGLTFNGRLYWTLVPTDFDVIYGPYMNHAHYAGLMEMLTPFPLVLSMSEFIPGSARIIPGFAAALMATTIFLSKSRGGMIVFAVQLLFVIVVLARQRQTRSILKWMVPFVAAVVVLILLTGTSMSPILSRFRDPSQSDVAGFRMQIVKDGIHMFAQRPFVGWGLGTFPSVYPHFRSFYSTFVVNQAHNDYLQVLIETGIVGFLLVMWFLVCVYRRSFSGIEGWRHDPAQAIKFAALVGCTGIVIHSFGDFNLHIPANAAWYYVLSAAAATRITAKSQ